jgi:hypothetical protein
MNEFWFSLIGAGVALLAGRLGIPLPGLPKPNPVTPTPVAPLPDLAEIIRSVLLEVLRGIAQPKQEDEVRKHLKAIVTKFD